MIRNVIMGSGSFFPFQSEARVQISSKPEPPVLRNLRWLPVNTQLYCRDATLTFKCMTDQAPEYLKSLYITRGSVSGRITRNFQRLNIPLFKTATGQKTFYYKSVSIWNKLDPSLKLCKSPASFETAEKKPPFE